MAFVQPVVLRRHGVRLEPLALEHEDGLRAAAADGQLWKLSVTSVPEPENTRTYIETELHMRQEGSRFAFAVIDEATGRELGTSSLSQSISSLVEGFFFRPGRLRTS